MKKQGGWVFQGNLEEGCPELFAIFLWGPWLDGEYPELFSVFYFLTRVLARAALGWVDILNCKTKSATDPPLIQSSDPQIIIPDDEEEDNDDEEEDDNDGEEEEDIDGDHSDDEDNDE